MSITTTRPTPSARRDGLGGREAAQKPETEMLQPQLT
jgi:hypothetical protein